VRVTALASGSSGNAYLIEQGTTRVLIDAGLPAPALERFLRLRGVDAASLSALFLSHEHTDHIRGAGALARRHGIPVVANEATFRAAAEWLGPLPERVVLPTGGECSAGPIRVRVFPVSHDAAEPVGFWIAAGGAHVCICTDLGEPTPAVREPLAGSDLLVLEANHDLTMLWDGPYPPALKRRVAGPRGHLANATTAQLLLDLGADGRARTVWLAHLSATNNTPDCAHAAVRGPLERAAYAHLRLEVAQRDRPSVTWEAPAPVAPAPTPTPLLSV
jgi:phosphoribosyl 1,2-cyclic phosphodiesterase